MTNKKEIFDFIKIGIINTVFYYGVYSVFLFIGVHYIVSAFFATILGILFNFKTFGKYVFMNEDKSRIFIFIFVYIMLYIINISFINFFSYFFSNYYIAGLLAIMPYAFFSFYLNKKFVFKKG